ncbi:hypothetical protein AB0F52_30090 [Amycolatopsis sp. NPDC024027]|uniref:hypothetical protein n=1 Tax=Amycolatopsis sp. NPDC024027 TaxID=3154327 RepID=UPI0033DF2694
MADPIEMIDSEIDVVRIPRPRSILRLLLGLVRLRSDRLKAGDRGATITEVAQVLSESGYGGRVTSHSPDGDRWSVTVPILVTDLPTGIQAEVR